MRSQKILVLGLVSILLFSTLGTTLGSSRSITSDIEDDEIDPSNVLFAGGNGTEDDPYEINNVTHLQNMNENLSAHYELVNDINASVTKSWNDEKGFMPIGNESARFSGSLDGQSYEVKDIYLNHPDEDNIGFFSFVGREGYVKDIKFTNGIINGSVGSRGSLGGLAGSNFGDIVNSDFDGKIDASGAEAGQSVAGGLVGFNEGNITDSSSNGTAIGFNCGTGGLVGWNTGNISRSFSKSEVISWGNFGGYSAGGLVCFNQGRINLSYATGSVGFDGIFALSECVGGLIGSNWIGGEISRVYASGDVRGTKEVGGLVGRNHGEISIGYSSGDVNTTSDEAGGLIGVNAAEGNISKVFSSGDVFAKSEYGSNNRIGGLVGFSVGRVYDSYSLSDIEIKSDEASKHIGGLIGEVGSSKNDIPGYVNQTYSVGTISGAEEKGGLIGNLSFGRVNYSYWDKGRSGVLESDGGTGLTTMEMIGNRAQDNMTGFDFNKTWETVENGVEYDGYPILRILERENQTEHQEKEINAMVKSLQIVEKDSKSAMLKGGYIPWSYSNEIEVYFQYKIAGEENWTETDSLVLEKMRKFQKEITGLKSGTEYEFRSVGETEGLRLEGKILTFTTEKVYELEMFSTEGGEIIEPEKKITDFENGSYVNIKASADENYHFVRWKGDNETIRDKRAESTSIQVLDDYSITAVFALKDRELKINIQGKGEIEPGVGIHVYKHGSNVTLSGHPAEGWYFDGWSGDVESGEEKINITLDSDKNITANFEEKGTGMNIIIGTIGGAIILLSIIGYIKKRRNKE